MLVVRAGILGAHAVLFATSMCIIFVNIIDEQNVFTHWFTYLVSPCKFEALLHIAGHLASGLSVAFCCVKGFGQKFLCIAVHYLISCGTDPHHDYCFCRLLSASSSQASSGWAS